MTTPGLELSNPAWVEEFVRARPAARDDAARLRLVVELARESARRGGGPFGAAVFRMDGGAIVSASVNRVLGLGTSLAHAEILAIASAQRALGSHDLGAPGLPPCELVTSTEPCTQCYGALIWSGLRRVVIGARQQDAEAIGFDEGPKPADWIGELTRRGIAVERDVLHAEAKAVLDEYARRGGPVYGPEREAT